MWTPEGRTKSVHSSEVSTIVKPTGVKLIHTRKIEQALRKVSIIVGCPQGEVLVYEAYLWWHPGM